MVWGTATAAAEEAPLAWTGLEDMTAEEAPLAWTGLEDMTAEATLDPAGAPAVVAGLTVVTTGFKVEEVTVERAGQLVTEAAQEVMVTHSVEKTVDEDGSSSGATTAAAVVTAGLASVVASATADEDEAAAVVVVSALVIWKGLEYWKTSESSP